eukprot:TRINITY_DN8209_c0_g1_i1.p1 TRINITY_DN8209_c0_g1~~TRINITY_DN8209_c0_g1_i1.p1  ORF type:complete len:731 (-),score=67.70 TRINITY_DN8209_c0_g1_i1:53-2179(-)
MEPEIDADRLQQENEELKKKLLSLQREKEQERQRQELQKENVALRRQIENLLVNPTTGAPVHQDNNSSDDDIEAQPVKKFDQQRPMAVPIPAAGDVLSVPQVKTPITPVTPVDMAPPCNHTSNWKRLRLKKGMQHFLCYECGAKWKTPSKSLLEAMETTTAPTAAPIPRPRQGPVSPGGSSQPWVGAVAPPFVTSAFRPPAPEDLSPHTRGLQMKPPAYMPQEGVWPLRPGMNSLESFFRNRPGNMTPQSLLNSLVKTDPHESEQKYNDAQDSDSNSTGNGDEGQTRDRTRKPSTALTAEEREMAGWKLNDEFDANGRRLDIASVLVYSQLPSGEWMFLLGYHEMTGKPPYQKPAQHHADFRGYFDYRNDNHILDTAKRRLREETRNINLGAEIDPRTYYDVPHIVKREHGPAVEATRMFLVASSHLRDDITRQFDEHSTIEHRKHNNHFQYPAIAFRSDGSLRPNWNEVTSLRWWSQHELLRALAAEGLALKRSSLQWNFKRALLRLLLPGGVNNPDVSIAPRFARPIPPEVLYVWQDLLQQWDAFYAQPPSAEGFHSYASFYSLPVWNEFLLALYKSQTDEPIPPPMPLPISDNPRHTPQQQAHTQQFQSMRAHAPPSVPIPSRAVGHAHPLSMPGGPSLPPRGARSPHAMLNHVLAAMPPSPSGHTIGPPMVRSPMAGSIPMVATRSPSHAILAGQARPPHNSGP